MNKSKLILCFFLVTVLRADDVMDEEMEEFEDVMPETISDMDSTEFVKDLEKHFESNPKDPLTVSEAIEVSIKIYSEASMDQIREMEAKLEKEDAKLTDEEENLLYFKNHLEDYFNTHHRTELTQEQLKDIIRTNAILSFLEKKMDEEEALINEDDDDDEGMDNDEDLDYPGDYENDDEDMMDEDMPEDLEMMNEEVEAN